MSRLSSAERLKRKNSFDGNLLYGAREFNVITKRDKHHDNRSRIEHKYYEMIDHATGLIKEELSVERFCPLCDNRSEDELFIKNGFRHLRCCCDSETEMVYVSPVLSENILNSFYQDDRSYSKVMTSDLQVQMDIKRSEYGLDIIEQYSPGKGKILDVGCGPGNFLGVARHRGWNVSGVEFNTSSVKKLRSDNIEVYDVPLEQTAIQAESFDCITMWAILEHITKPKDFLKEIYRMLKPGGIILILVPNFDSLVIRIMHEKAQTFAGHSHINHFNNISLRKLLSMSGFNVLESETILSEIGTVNNYLNFHDPFLGNSKNVIDFFTPEYLHENFLGYMLLMIAKK